MKIAWSTLKVCALTHVVMTNGPAKSLRLKSRALLSRFTDMTTSQLMQRVIENGKFSHAAFETNISSLDILILYQLGETLERKNGCGEKPEAQRAVRFRFVIINSAHLMSVCF